MSVAPRRTPAHRARPGFSLLELLVSLAIMAVALAAVTARVNRAAYDADAAARTLAGALQTAQRLAITQQSTVVVGFDTLRGRVRVLEDRNGNLHYDPLPSDSERVTWRPLDPATAAFAAPAAGVNGPVSASLANTDSVYDGLPSVVFRRDGAGSVAAEAYLRVVRGGTTEWRAVVVTRATGRVNWWAASTKTGTPVAAGAWTRRAL